MEYNCIWLSILTNSFFFLINNRLSTSVRTVVQGWQGDILCSFCKNKMECGSHLFFWIISLKLKEYLLEGTIYHVSTTCIHPFTLSPLHVRGLILVAETCNTTSCLRYVMACKWEEAIKCNGEMLIWRNLAMEVGKIALVAIVYNLWKQGNNNFFFFFYRVLTYGVRSWW